MRLSDEAISYMKERYDALNRERGYIAKIVQEVKDKFNIVINKDHIRYYCQIESMREKIQEVNDTVEDEEPFKFANDRYLIGDFSFTREEMDEVFRHYSKFGENLTGDEMRKKFGFKSEAWDLLKRAMRLYKTSHVICPETAKLLTEEQLDRVIEDAIGESHDRITAKMVNTNRKMEEKELKKYRKVLGNIDYFLENLALSVKRIDWNYEPRRYVEPKNSDVGRYFVTDVHFGKAGSDKMIARLWLIRDEILKMPECKIIIHNLGDLMESMLQGGFHFGHSEEMEVRPEDQLLLATRTFRDVLLSLYEAGKDVEFHTIGGNHDRVGKNHDEDIIRTGNYWFGNMLEMLLEKTTVKIHLYTDLISCYQSDTVNYVMLHRDQGLDKKRPDELIMTGMQDGSIDPKKYTVILGGHTHAAEFKETTLCKYIVVPTLAGPDGYSRYKIVKHSIPGYVRVMENSYGSVDVEFKSLH